MRKRVKYELPADIQRELATAKRISAVTAERGAQQRAGLLQLPAVSSLPNLPQDRTREKSSRETRQTGRLGKLHRHNSDADTVRAMMERLDMQAALNTGWGSKTLSSPGTLTCDLGTAVPAVAGPVRMWRNSSMAVPSASEGGLPTQLGRASRGGADTPAAKGLVAKRSDKPLVLPSTMLKWTTNTWGGDGDSGLLDEEDEEAESSGNVNFCEAVRPALVPTGLPMVPRKAGTLKALIQKGAVSTRRISGGMVSDMSDEPAAFTFLQTVEVARAAKRLAKLQPRKPPHVQLATIMNESHDTRRRKILNRMLDDSVVKEHMVRGWLQDMGEVTVKARAGKQVGLNELKALREAFDEADSTKCKSPRLSRLVSLSLPRHPIRRCIAGVVGFGELHLEEEEPAIHPAWLPLRRMLQKILYDQENSSAFLRGKPKGAMKNAAFRKRVASRCVTFEDMLHASYPEIPPAELERLKAMSDHLMAKVSIAPTHSILQ
eukprot:jgi/Tetstr1/422073/TSEL_012933.t1